MYSTAGLKFSRRWRRMAWRLNSHTFAAFVGSAVISLAVMRSFVSAAGPTDTRACRSSPRAPPHVAPATTLCRLHRSLSFPPLPLPLSVWLLSPADRRRVEAGGSYKRRKHAETDDNPLYRLPETPGGSQRLDGMSQWSAKAHQYEHH